MWQPKLLPIFWTWVHIECLRCETLGCVSLVHLSEYTLNAVFFHQHLPTNSPTSHSKVRKWAIPTARCLPIWPFSHLASTFLSSVSLDMGNFLCLFLMVEKHTQDINHVSFVPFPHSLCSFCFHPVLPLCCCEALPKEPVPSSLCLFLRSRSSAGRLLFPTQVAPWWYWIKTYNFRQHWNRSCVPEAFKKEKVGWHPNIPRASWLWKLHLFA